jgi:hypothetical protein
MHQLLVCAENFKLLGESKNTIKKNTQISLDASKKVDLEVNTQSVKYVLSLDFGAQQS